MKTYKIEKVERIRNLGGKMIDVKIREIADLLKFEISEVSKTMIKLALRVHNEKYTGFFLIAEYDDDKYIKYVGEFWAENGIQVLDYLPEHNLMCDIANNPISDKEKWAKLIDFVSEHDILDYLIDMAEAKGKEKPIRHTVPLDWDGYINSLLGLF